MVLGRASYQVRRHPAIFGEFGRLRGNSGRLRKFASAGGATAAFIFGSGSAGAGSAASGLRWFLWAGGFDGVSHSNGVVIGLDFREVVEKLLLVRRFDALRQMPALVGEMRTPED